MKIFFLSVLLGLSAMTHASAPSCVPAGASCKTATDTCCLDRALCGATLACAANPDLADFAEQVAGGLELPDSDTAHPPPEPCPGDVCQ